MRVLIDTNIFIYRENEHVVPKNLQHLVVAFDGAGVRILVHPRSTDDIFRDHDVARREVILSKLGSYSFLEFPPDPTADGEFQARVGRISTPNDKVDSAILYALYRDAVDYLVTEDKDLRKKSEKVGLGNRVLSVDQALQVFLPARTEPRLSRPPALEKLPVHHLKISEQFFDPLKKDYPEFEEWFKKISREGRQSFAYFREDGSLGALMIPKFEDGIVDSNPPLPRKKRMKIALLKVDYTGHKIGELFIKLSVHDAIAAGCEELYLTRFVKPNDTLVELICEYGFEPVAKNERGEDIFTKDLRPDARKLAILHPVQVSQKYYPIFCDSRSVKKYLVPIRPEYHEKLFVDYLTRQTTLPEYRSQFIVEGNTIKKAYLCNSNNRTIRRGDIMLFYRSGDNQEVTSIGVVESIHVNLRHAEEVAKVAAKRTVYSVTEIRDMLQRPTIVFLFTWHFYLPKPVTLSHLQQMGISSPQSLTRISHQKYLEIKKRGGIDERFTVN
jgi:hypothetical protein